VASYANWALTRRYQRKNTFADRDGAASIGGLFNFNRERFEARLWTCPPRMLQRRAFVAALHAPCRSAQHVAWCVGAPADDEWGERGGLPTRATFAIDPPPSARFLKRTKRRNRPRRRCPTRPPPISPSRSIFEIEIRRLAAHGDYSTAAAGGESSRYGLGPYGWEHLLDGPPCRTCRPHAPFAELVRLSQTSVTDEMREEHGRAVLGE